MNQFDQQPEDKAEGLGSAARMVPQRTPWNLGMRLTIRLKLALLDTLLYIRVDDSFI